MAKKNYEYHFGYIGGSGILKTAWIKSQFGSDKLTNVAWTAPFLVGLGVHMHSSIGYLKMLQFLPLCIISIAVTQRAFSPKPEETFVM